MGRGTIDYDKLVKLDKKEIKKISSLLNEEEREIFFEWLHEEIELKKLIINTPKKVLENFIKFITQKHELYEEIWNWEKEYSENFYSAFFKFIKRELLLKELNEFIKRWGEEEKEKLLTGKFT